MPYAVEYHDVSFVYPGAPREGGGAREALRGVTLAVEEGDRLGILGPNGGGKSTLLKITLGLLPGYGGEVRVLGMHPREARRRGLVGYVPQRNEAELAFPLCVRDVVEMPALLHTPAWRRPGRGVDEAVRHAMSVVGVLDLAGRAIGELSGGQVQRVMIARALASRPRLLLLDEPTVGIDPAGLRRFGDLLARLRAERGLTVIIVSHDIRTVALGCDHIACLSRTLHSHVSPGGLTPQLLADVFRHDVAAIFGDVHVDAHPAGACRDPSHAHGKGGHA